MNAYYKVAQNYFQHMEGWHLYPGPREPWMWTWIVLAFSWGASFVLLFQTLPNLLSWQFAMVLVLEVPFILVAGKISDRKRAALFAAPPGQEVSSSDLEAFRSKLLCEYLAASPDKFLQIADEINDLIDMRKKFRKSSEIDWGNTFRKIYDPDAKQRVLAVFLAGLTVLTALALKIGDLPSIFDVLESQDVHRLLGGALSIAAVLFVMLIGIQVLGAVLWNAMIIWIAKSFKKTAFSDGAALRYLVRDLLLYYRASGLEDAAQSKATSPSQEPAANSIICEREDQLAD